MVHAALARGAAWPRTGASLARLVATAAARDPDHARWVAHPEDALIRALRHRAGGAPIASAAWGVPAFGDALAGHATVWMPPAPGQLDPGAADVAAALDAGAGAVLLAPVAGDCAPIAEIARLCAARGLPFALDARMASGGRVLDGPPGAWGDLTLLSVHGEPGPAPCPGAVLVGDVTAETPDGSPSSWRHGAALLRDSIASEPRLRRLIAGRDTVRAPQDGAAPAWAFAAAAARLQQAPERASQRARHARTLRANIGHVEGITVPLEPTGGQSASSVLGVLAAQRDSVRSQLLAAGVACPALGGWLTDRDRPPRSEELAESTLFLPLHPFFRPRDLVQISETLRRAALGALPE